MTKRPAHVKPPAYLSPNTPVPLPQKASQKPEADDPLGLNPVRYGDWNLKGIAVDF